MASGKIKQKVETYKRKAREENVPCAFVVSSSNDVKFETMMKTMDKLMDRISVEKSETQTSEGLILPHLHKLDREI